jgi:hypothetical protein
MQQEEKSKPLGAFGSLRFHAYGDALSYAFIDFQALHVFYVFQDSYDFQELYDFRELHDLQRSS